MKLAAELMKEQLKHARVAREKRIIGGLTKGEKLKLAGFTGNLIALNDFRDHVELTLSDGETEKNFYVASIGDTNRAPNHIRTDARGIIKVA